MFNSTQVQVRALRKLKAGEENGAIEVEFEVDSNINGQVWQYRLLDNNTRIAQGSATTVAPSGSFEVRKVTANRAGQDVIVGQEKEMSECVCLLCPLLLDVSLIS